MSLILSGSDGLSDIDGSASTPAIRGTDTNTGIFFPAADTIAFAEGGAEAMRIDSSGNVGIGTNSPNARLEALSSTAGAEISRFEGNYSASGTVNLTNWRRSGGAVASVMRYNDANTNMEFGTTTSHSQAFITGGSERMRIDSSGVLCVGTTGLGNNGTRMSVSGANRVVRILGSTEGEGAFMVDKTTNTNTTSQVFIQFSINNQAIGNGQINANGASQAAFGSFSDRRLKENIVDLEPQLANICALRPVEFDYIESEGGGHQIGFVAQEIQEVYPDIVGERSDGMLTLSGFNKTEARLIKAIQELSAKNDALEARLAALEAK